MVSFSHQPAPLLLSVLRLRTEKEVLAAVQNGLVHGAGGFDLHLSCLEESARTPEALARIFSSTKKPFMALHYNMRADGSPLGHTDEERMELLLTAARAGAAAVDMQGYTFDADTHGSLALAGDCAGFSFVSADPNEVSLRPEVIARQTTMIDEVHALGAEVVLSTHTGVPLSCAQATDLARFLERRNPDVIKLVVGCPDEAGVDECYRTVLELKRTLHVPFSIHCGGVGRVTRVIAPLLGSYLVFCNDGYTPASDPNQLDLQTMSVAVRGLDWRKNF